MRPGGGGVASLNHEVGYHAMKNQILVQRMGCGLSGLRIQPLLRAARQPDEDANRYRSFLFE